MITSYNLFISESSKREFIEAVKRNDTDFVKSYNGDVSILGNYAILYAINTEKVDMVKTLCQKPSMDLSLNSDQIFNQMVNSRSPEIVEVLLNKNFSTPGENDVFLSGNDLLSKVIDRGHQKVISKVLSMSPDKTGIKNIYDRQVSKIFNNNDPVNFKRCLIDTRSKRAKYEICYEIKFSEEMQNINSKEEHDNLLQLIDVYQDYMPCPLNDKFIKSALRFADMDVFFKIMEDPRILDERSDEPNEEIARIIEFIYHLLASRDDDSFEDKKKAADIIISFIGSNIQSDNQFTDLVIGLALPVTAYKGTSIELTGNKSVTLTKDEYMNDRLWIYIINQIQKKIGGDPLPSFYEYLLSHIAEDIKNRDVNNSNFEIIFGDIPRDLSKDRIVQKLHLKLQGNDGSEEDDLLDIF